MTASNAFGRQVVIPLTNKSGGSVAAGDVVIIDSANNDAFTTTTSSGYTGGIGIAQETIASNATGRVLIEGYAALVNVNASVTRGNYGKSHTVAKQATDAGASRGVGTFCQFLTGGTTPDARVYAADLGGTSLTNPMTTTGDIIYSSDGSGTPARLAIGATGRLLTVASGLPAWSAVLSEIEATMNSASTTLGTSYTPPTDIGGLSVSCTAGTWLFFTNLLFVAVGANRSFYAKVWDGTTTFDEFESSAVSALRVQASHVSRATVLVSTTTVKVSASTDAGASNTVSRNGGNGTTNSASTLIAVRIA